MNFNTLEQKLQQHPSFHEFHTHDGGKALEIDTDTLYLVIYKTKRIFMRAKIKATNRLIHGNLRDGIALLKQYNILEESA